MTRIIALFMLMHVASGGARSAATQNPTEPPANRPQAESEHTGVDGKLVGVYFCKGQNPDGTEYHGVVEIARTAETFLVHWALSSEVSVFGVGIRTSDGLAVSYFGGTPGIAVYRVDGEQLVGEWTVGGAGTVFRETLTPIPDDWEPAPRKRTPSRTPVRQLRL